MKKDPTSGNPPLPLERIDEMILWIRGRRVILDTDLATLYSVATKAFNQAVKRKRKSGYIWYGPSSSGKLGAWRHLLNRFITSTLLRSGGNGFRAFVPVG
jgi:hypothetical protein